MREHPEYMEGVNLFSALPPELQLAILERPALLGEPATRKALPLVSREWEHLTSDIQGRRRPSAVRLYISLLLALIYGSRVDVREKPRPRLRFSPEWEGRGHLTVLAGPWVGTGGGQEDGRTWEIRSRDSRQDTWASGQDLYPQAVELIAEWFATHPKGSVSVAKWNPDQMADATYLIPRGLSDALITSGMDPREKHVVDVEGWDDYFELDHGPLLLPSPREWVRGVTDHPNLEPEAVRYVQGMYEKAAQAHRVAAQPELGVGGRATGVRQWREGTRSVPIVYRV